MSWKERLYKQQATAWLEWLGNTLNCETLATCTHHDDCSIVMHIEHNHVHFATMLRSGQMNQAVVSQRDLSVQNKGKDAHNNCL
jgi:hypothetical protein